MFVHWSNTSTNYRDMEKLEIHCDRCNGLQIHTIRLYEKKTKHYSILAIGADYTISKICHGCLLEIRAPKNEESILVKKYHAQIACWEGFELLNNGNHTKAIKKFNKSLKLDPNFSQAMFGMAQSLIGKNELLQAKKYADILMDKYPDSPDVVELIESIKKNL